ncbi:MAG TPA: hydrogenase maturation nickel metallochaperone HypA [Candidatus Dormibacteraeota bacterium]|jgi:hydrogenase nickel incorporation protein HypA/HybF|nr:hydrogenase maturation nickel metallochaperone HypA [Candidatus Dormibacteraeota bacterium]
MHELSITSYLLDAVQEEAERLGARRVVSIDLVIGERMAVIDDSLRYCFELLAAGTPAEGASVNVRRVSMRFRCPEHGEYGPSGADFACPQCGAVGEISEPATQLLVESLEIER